MIIRTALSSAEEVVGALGSDAQAGLSQDEARLRLERYGRNELAAEPPAPAWKKFLAQFADPLVILLLVATAISAGLWLLERESVLPYEAIAILAVVLLNALLGFVQEARAEQAVAALRRMSAAQANVLRDGTRRRIPAAEVVPGDLLLVEAGRSGRPAPDRRAPVLQVAVIYLPLLQQAFSTVALGAADWLFCAVVASSVLWLTELSKRVRANSRQALEPPG